MHVFTDRNTLQNMEEITMKSYALSYPVDHSPGSTVPTGVSLLEATTLD